VLGELCVQDVVADAGVVVLHSGTEDKPVLEEMGQHFANG
jgi:hypothetical protein